MAEVKLKEETELWEPRGPCGSWGPAEEHTHTEACESKEEPELCIKQEPQEFPFHMVTVKTEDDEDKSSVLPQRPTEENREETNGWDCGAEAGCSSDPLTQFHSDSEEEEHTDSSEDTDHSEDYSQEQAPAKRSTAGRKEHQRNLHLICPVCRERFPNEIKLAAHLQVHVEDRTVRRTVLESENTKAYSCALCAKAFGRRAHLGRHMIVHREEKRHRCSVCEKEFKQKKILKEHARTHTGEKPFVCSVCEKAFAQVSTLSRHQKHVHHICSVCKDRLTDRIKLNEHLKAHVEDGTLEQALLERKYSKRHACSLCEKEFRSKSNLDRHMFVHTGEKPFKCLVCEKSFTFKFEVDQHVIFVHHVCPVCEEGFTTDSDLHKHLQTHVEDGSVDATFLNRVNMKPYNCSLCRKEFNCKTAFQRHALVHTGEKPFTCAVCQKTFTQKGSLKTHQKIHTSERRFICSACDKSFITRSNLKAHVKTHATPDLCGFSAHA